MNDLTKINKGRRIIKGGSDGESPNTYISMYS